MLSRFIQSSGKPQTHWAGVFEITPSYLSDLVAGKKTPSLILAVRIERLTGGAVPASGWIPEDQTEITEHRGAA